MFILIFRFIFQWLLFQKLADKAQNGNIMVSNPITHLSIEQIVVQNNVDLKDILFTSTFIDDTQ